MPISPNNLFDRFRRLDSVQKRLLGEAAIELAKSSLVLGCLPFRKAIRSGSVALGSRAGSIDNCIWAIEAAARRVPWRAVCIHKGLALQRMLRSRGLDARLHYGIGNDEREGALQAHVWVTVDGKTLIGAFEEQRFAPVAAYP